MITALEAAQMQARMDAGKRKKPATPPHAVKRETDLHEQIADECKRRGWLAFHSRMDRRSTSTVGMPDFVILGTWISDEGTCSPSVWCIECKRRLGKLSPAQQATSAWAAKLGHKIHVVRSFSEFLEVIQ